MTAAPWSRFTPEQRRAAFLVDRPVLAAAGAGAGKTAVMAVRYVACLLRGGAAGASLGVERVLAITFTREAAANLRARIDRTLRAVLAARRFPRLLAEGEGLDEAELDEPALAHLRTCLAGLAGAPIGTVDGFCLGLAAEHAAELGRDPALAPPDELAAAQVEERAWQALRAEAAAAGGGELLPLARRHGEGEVRALLERLAGQAAALPEPLLAAAAGDPAARLLALRAPHLEALWAAVQAARPVAPPAAARLLAALPAACPRDPAGVAALARGLEGLAARGGGEAFKDAARCIRAALAYPNPAEARPDQRRRGGSLAALAAWDPAREAALAAEAAAAATLARRLLELQAEVAGALGLEGFAASEAQALRLLADPGLRRRLGTRFRHVLLDEAQDLNRLQARLVEALEGALVFAVGDHRQSIFGFRHAAPAVFAGWRARLAAGGGAVAELAENFRSHPELVQGVVRLVAQPALRDAFAPEAIRPGRTAEGTARLRAVRLQASQAGEPVPAGRRLASQAAARWVAARIAASVAAGRRPEEHAVLLRTRSRMTVYAAALEAAGVAVDTDFPGGLIAAQECHDVEAVLRLCCDPHDREALGIALGGPWSGAAPDDRTLLVEALEHADAAAAWALAAERSPLGGLVAGLRPLLAQAGPGAVVRRLAADPALAARYGALPLARHRIATLLRLAEEDAGGGRHLDAVAWLARLRERRRLGVDDAAAGGEAVGGRGVRLMTIHGAKGLEWPVVVLPELDMPLRHRDADGWAVAESADDRLLLSCRPPREERQGAIGLAAELAAEALRRRALAEEARLFYVACTRARDELDLVLTGEAPAGPDGDGRVACAGGWVTGAGLAWEVAAVELADPPPPALAGADAGPPLPALAAAAAPDAGVRGVGELAERAAPAPLDGTGWERALALRLGEAVHAALAAHGPGMPSAVAAQALAGLPELPPERRAGLLAALADPGLLPGYWSGERLVEQPVAGELAPGRLASGVCDLLLKGADGAWRLYDWKTGQGAAAPAATLQVQAYAALVAPHLDAPLAAAALVDVEGRRVLPVAIDAASCGAACARLAAAWEGG